MIIGEYKLSNLLTYLGVSLSIFSVVFILNGQLDAAMIAFVLSGICDLFDGAFARSFKRTAEQEAFGIELDSLCDMINFAALPAVLLIKVSSVTYLGLLTALVYVLAAITRLAYFNRDAKGAERSSYFTGLPVTYSALVFPLWYVCCHLLAPELFALSLPIIALVLAFLFVWNKKIPKPKKLAYLFFLLLAIMTIGFLLGFILW